MSADVTTPAPPAPPVHRASDAAASPPLPVLVIRPTPGWKPVNFAELWRYREMLWFLALRDVQVRYKQTVLGAAWAVIQPLFTMLVFSVFFGKLGGIENKLESGTPYTLFTLAALLPWQLFAFAMAQMSTSVIGNRGLLTKVYFPRLIVPLAPLLCGLLDFAISLGVLVVMMAGYRLAGYDVRPGWQVLTLPLFVLLALATSLAVGLWLAALNALYRDVQYTLPFLTQFWMLLTPVAYPSSIVPERWRWLYGLNPMAGVVDGFRWALLGDSPPGPMLMVSVPATLLLLVGGLFFFRRMEQTFADRV